MITRFKVVFMDEVLEFFDGLDDNAREKILFNIDKSRQGSDPRLFKKLTSSIWEFRTLYANKQYRLFSFWDRHDHQNTLVVATHGIVKKSQKTPRKDIEKAMDKMNRYFESKKRTR